VKLLQLVSEAARMDLALQLIMGQLNKPSAGHEAMKNDIEGKINTGQDKMENSIIATKEEIKKKTLVVSKIK
jgi:hypothetical protein